MDFAYQAATDASVMSRIQPVFDAAFSYWAEKHDFIPDDLGLVGIVDDAYLTRMLLESVSTLHAQQVGQPLLSVDLGPANRTVREIIGEPVASQLDALVGQTVASQVIQTSLQQLMGFGQMTIPMANFGYYMGDYELQHEVDVRLGAMGVV